MNSSSVKQIIKSAAIKAAEMIILFVGLKLNQKNIANMIDIVAEIIQISIFFVPFVMLLFKNKYVVDMTEKQFSFCKDISKNALTKSVFRICCLYSAIGVCVYLACCMQYTLIAILLFIDVIIRVALLILYMPYIFKDAK
jgi:hypothetical protein